MLAVKWDWCNCRKYRNIYRTTAHISLMLKAWSRFLLSNTNDGLIDCHSLQAIRYKQVTVVTVTIVLSFILPYASFITHSDNAADVIWLKKRLDACFTHGNALIESDDICMHFCTSLTRACKSKRWHGLKLFQSFWHFPVQRGQQINRKRPS